jgi:endonuclease G
MRNSLVLAFASALALLSGCLVDEEESLSALTQDVVVVSEGFETGSKAAYAAANVALSSGTWNLDDALIGTSASDVKVGAKAVRVRGSGRVTMQFDVAGGVGSVTVMHARYGTDTGGSFGLFWSQNSGGTWTQAGASVTPGASLATASFAVNRSGAVRLQLRKLDGTSSRIDLDAISVESYGTSPPPPPPPGDTISVHTTLGLPSPASTSSWNDYLSVKSQYVLSYNSARKIPNWVSWELNSSYLGSAARQDDYRTDSTLPAGMPQATLADFSGSGWDRGHLCPSGDRTKTTAANSQTFILSNMVPQSQDSNGGPWAALETYSRSLAADNELFVIAGGAFSGGAQTIGNGVEIPDDMFKVVVVLDDAGQPVTTATRVIGVLIPNDDSAISPGDSWRQFRISVDDIEELTGLDFLSAVDPAVQAVIESRVDTQ